MGFNKKYDRKVEYKTIEVADPDSIGHGKEKKDFPGLRGLNTHRLIREDDYYETEVKLSDTFNEMNEQYRDIIPNLLYGTDVQNLSVTDHEKTIIATVIQWLGTPVGKGFLESCGFTRGENLGTKKKRQELFDRICDSNNRFNESFLIKMLGL